MGDGCSQEETQGHEREPLCVCVCGSHLRFLLLLNRGTRVHLCMSRASAVGVAGTIYSSCPHLSAHRSSSSSFSTTTTTADHLASSDMKHSNEWSTTPIVQSGRRQKKRNGRKMKLQSERVTPSVLPQTEGKPGNQWRSVRTSCPTIQHGFNADTHTCLLPLDIVFMSKMRAAELTD